MDAKLFFIGLFFLLIGSLMYYYIKGEKPSSEKTNWQGITISAYIQYWGGVILCIICGIIFIIRSFSSYN